ncbi:MAG: GNAT family N-acetyltransferase [Gemmatimonadota bacterium]|nr:GNAT family N-acetyltransferase [Gemmatimonadota bacterium]MDH3427461.1 GNAT family N-acetyltransferase [Gemmatimonadota bacterium]
MSTTIRQAEQADRDRIVLFNQALALETEGRTLDRATLTQGVTRMLSDASTGRYFVAEDGGEIVGQLAVTVEWSDWRNAEIWWIQSVYVARSHRRRGTYRRLHEHVCDLARGSRVAGLRLYVERDNEAAQSTYESLGMQRSPYVMYDEYWF